MFFKLLQSWLNEIFQWENSQPDQPLFSDHNILQHMSAIIWAINYSNRTRGSSTVVVKSGWKLSNDTKYSGKCQKSAWHYWGFCRLTLRLISGCSWDKYLREIKPKSILCQLSTRVGRVICNRFCSEWMGDRTHVWDPQRLLRSFGQKLMPHQGVKVTYFRRPFSRPKRPRILKIRPVNEVKS